MEAIDAVADPFTQPTLPSGRRVPGPVSTSEPAPPTAPALPPTPERPSNPTLESRRTLHPGAPPPRPERAPLAVGQIVGERYRIESKLGAGGMGEVWAAEHVTIRSRVALKVLLPHALQVPEILARFEREAVLLGRARGEHVPQVMDFFEDPALGPVLVTELVEGTSLARELEDHVTVARALEIGLSLARGLEALHAASVVHRDLKPSNVILRRSPSGEARAVILDLGVSRLMDDAVDPDMERITSAELVVGTVEYMSPEQVLSSREAAPAADLYALGALLYRAVAGAHAYGPTLSRVELLRAKLTTEAPPLPVEPGDARAVGLARVVAKALERDPEKRYATAAEMRAALEAVASPAPAQAPTVLPQGDRRSSLPEVWLRAKGTWTRGRARRAPVESRSSLVLTFVPLVLAAALACAAEGTGAEDPPAPPAQAAMVGVH